MTQRALIAAALALPLIVPATLLRADDVKTGLKCIVTVTAVKNGKEQDPVPAPGVAVRVFAEGGDKAVAEGKADDKGIFLVAVPAGKYRVEVDHPPGAVKTPPAKVQVLDGDVMDLNVNFIVRTR